MRIAVDGFTWESIYLFLGAPKVVLLDEILYLVFLSFHNDPTDLDVLLGVRIIIGILKSRNGVFRLVFFLYPEHLELVIVLKALLEVVNEISFLIEAIQEYLQTFYMDVFRNDKLFVVIELLFLIVVGHQLHRVRLVSLRLLHLREFYSLVNFFVWDKTILSSYRKDTAGKQFYQFLQVFLVQGYLVEFPEDGFDILQFHHVGDVNIIDNF